MLLIVCKGVNIHAQTSGSLSFSVTTTEPPGNYSGVHVFALWIEDASGNFIKTKMRYAQSRIQYLNVWINQSNYNVTDAITGPTIGTHGTKTITWNATDVSGTLVPDGTYHVWMQMSDKNSAGPTHSVTFVKGPTPISNQTFSNSGNFTNITLSWTPSGIGIGGAACTNAAVVYPDPFVSSVNFTLATAGICSLKIFDVNGKLVYRSVEAQTGTLQWQSGNALPGVYFYSIETGSSVFTGKIVKSGR